MNDILCIYQCPWFGVFGPNIPNFPEFFKYIKTGITQPKDDIYTWVRLNLMLNVEFNTLNDFLCIDAYDQGYLGLISLTCPNSTDTQKQV